MRPNTTRTVVAIPANPALRAVLLTIVFVLVAALYGIRVAHAGDTADTEASEAVEPTKLSVLEAAAARGIEDRKPVDPGATLQVGERVWLWLSVANPGQESEVELVWKHDGQTRWTVALEVGHSSRGWRTWAKKKLRAGDEGRWTVDVIATDGTVLHTVTFDVAPAAPDTTASAQ